jgi:hypothetical protein
MPRPLMQRGVGDLEALFARAKTDVKMLKQLEHELQYRHVPRAVALLAEVQAALYGATSATPAPVPPKEATSPQQTGLWERPATPVVPAPVATSRAEDPVKAPVAPAVPKTQQAASPSMSVEDAYKLLKATSGSTWESIEQTRRQMVQQSQPARLKSMSPERRNQVLTEAKMVNAAYAALSQARCSRS